LTNLIKWAGGKAKLAPLFKDYAVFSHESFYVEPFLGGGGSFLQLKGEFAAASDKNNSLIALWSAVRDDLGGLMARYESHYARHSRDSYYEAREQYNLLKPWGQHEKLPGLFLYLINTCFNGLCRYNLHGEFNTPIGDRIPSVASVREKLLLVQSKIENTAFHCWDFEETISYYKSKPNAFFYCDPPYSQVNGKGFQDYTGDWKETDADRLVQVLKASGCDFAVSEIDCPAVRERYADYPMIELKANRSIGGNRSKVRELLVLSRI
jgi:DNA adenine methylase